MMQSAQWFGRGKIHQIDNVIATSMAEGMISMNNSLSRLMRGRQISRDTCISHSSDPEQMQMRLM